MGTTFGVFIVILALSIGSHFYSLGPLFVTQSLHILHNAVKRNTIRLLQAVTIPQKYQGAVMNICFSYIASPDEAVAVKAFSLTVLQHLAETYPEILPELKLLIEERWDYETAAFRSRAKKIL